MDETTSGRADLGRWVADRPVSFLDASPHLVSLLELTAGDQETAHVVPRLAAFGVGCASVVDPAVATMERHRDLPAHRPYDGVGREVQQVEFHPARDVAGAVVWGSGLLSCNRGGRAPFEQAALFYLLSHVGEGGLACPAVCTAGLARALERRGPEDLRARHLDALLADDWASRALGSQFLTEVQGGSDVGANSTVARRDTGEPGAWRLDGEKWFCSVADADLFAVTARPEGAAGGTRGLGCFLVPRTLDGVTPNGFTIRRLKDKLGTRCLASAEIDLHGALGWPIGEPEVGFRIAVEDLLDTSRWLNALGSSGLMRRAYLEASSYARHRRSFGAPIGSFSAVRAQLATMKADEHAALASTLMLTGLLSRCDDGTATDGERAAHRVLVNANKFVTSIDATDVVHRGIEVLGGNGTIEDFSCLPRLYRDAIVYESWEGTHHVLCAQVHRDLGRLGLLDPMLGWLRGHLDAADGAVPAAGSAALDALEPHLRAAAGEPAGGRPVRPLVERLVRIVQAALLAELAERSSQRAHAATAELFAARHLGTMLDAPVRAELADDALDGDAG